MDTRETRINEVRLLSCILAGELNVNARGDKADQFYGYRMLIQWVELYKGKLK